MYDYIGRNRALWVRKNKASKKLLGLRTKGERNSASWKPKRMLPQSMQVGKITRHIAGFGAAIQV